MDRRQFLRTGLAGALAVAGGSAASSACTKNLRATLMENMEPSSSDGGITPEGWRILAYGALAPSGHNSQPWFVRPVSSFEWIIGSDHRRWLPEVDRNNREVILSLGAFIENLVQAASAMGFGTDVEILTQNRFAPEVARMVLNPAKPKHIPLERLEKRRTVKQHLLSRQLSRSDVDLFAKAADGRLHYFPSTSRHSDFMARAAVENFSIQYNNEKAMEEAAKWTRLTIKDARTFRDGLTPEGMEITGLAKLYVRHFLNSKDVKGKTFRDRAIAKVAAQAKEGAGWLVLVSDGESVSDLIAAGRRFQRMALLAGEKMIGIHPMTQTLEETHGRATIRRHHGAAMIPQFMLRVGYVNKYPEPVSLRRPVDWFLVS